MLLYEQDDYVQDRMAEDAVNANCVASWHARAGATGAGEAPAVRSASTLSRAAASLPDPRHPRHPGHRRLRRGLTRAHTATCPHMSSLPCRPRPL
jgi:hypothetical protein